MRNFFYATLCAFAAGCCQSSNNEPMSNSTKNSSVKSQMTCKLTSAELQARKATVIASLKKKMAARKELPNGFSYKFEGTDNVIDELTTFVKTERQCCNFFDLSISVKGDAPEAWLTITGQEGVKEFIEGELAL
jgi:hypothetical protein